MFFISAPTSTPHIWTTGSIALSDVEVTPSALREQDATNDQKMQTLNRSKLYKLDETMTSPSSQGQNIKETTKTFRQDGNKGEYQFHLHPTLPYSPINIQARGSKKTNKKSLFIQDAKMPEALSAQNKSIERLLNDQQQISIQEIGKMNKSSENIKSELDVGAKEALPNFEDPVELTHDDKVYEALYKLLKVYEKLKVMN